MGRRRAAMGLVGRRVSGTNADRETRGRGGVAGLGGRREEAAAVKGALESIPTKFSTTGGPDTI